MPFNPDEADATLSIYPNPANDYFNLASSTAEDLKDARLSIVDLSGKIVLRKTLLATNHQRISISPLAKGMYFIRIIKSTGTVTRKLLIQ